MTTADIEAAKFKEIYGMDVVRLPTNQDGSVNDVVYVNEEEFNALVKEIKEIHEKSYNSCSENFKKKRQMQNSMKRAMISQKAGNRRNMQEIVTYWY